MRKPVAVVFCGLLFGGQNAIAWECQSDHDLYELDGQEVCLTPQQAAQVTGATATEGEDTFHTGRNAASINATHVNATHATVPQRCDPAIETNFVEYQNSCTVKFNSAQASCSASETSDPTLKQLKREYDELLAQRRSLSGAVQGGPSAQTQSAGVNTINAKIAENEKKKVDRLKILKESCVQQQASCVQHCDHSQNGIQDLAQANSPVCNAEAEAPLAAVGTNLSACDGFAQKVREFTAKIAAAESTHQQAQAVVQRTSASATPTTDPQASADPAAADTTAPAGNPDDTAYNSDPGAYEEGAPQDQEKKKKNGNEMAGLLSAAGSLLSAFMQPKPEPQMMQPAELPAGDCRRPENMSSQICRCQMNWTPDCAGPSQERSEDFASNTIPTGGAKLQKNDQTSLTLPKDEMPFPEFRKNPDQGGGGGGGGFYGGGGGVNTMPASFTPDAPEGRGGSKLSADILNGTYGGSPMGGTGGRPVGLRPIVRASGSTDPENLPGYGIGRQDEKPDFNRFLPPGAGAAAGARRSVSGVAGPSRRGDLHPAEADLFQVVSSRYRALESTLYRP